MAEESPKKAPSSTRLAWTSIIPALGAEITSHTARELAARLLAEEEQGGRVSTEATTQTNLAEDLAALIREHSVLLLRGGETLSPLEIRALYEGAHRGLGVGWSRPTPRPPHTVVVGTKWKESEEGSTELQNIHGTFIPDFPETHVVGCRAAGDELHNWHGLTGVMEPVNWYCKHSTPFHHDGAFSGTTPTPPVLVSMYCEEKPRRGDGVLRLWEEDEKANSSAAPSVPFEAGATLFFSTKQALRLADPALVARARRMNCVYRTGFGKIIEGVWPTIARNGLVPLAPADPHADSGYRTVTELNNSSGPPPGAEDLFHRAEDGAKEFRHALVQRDEQTGEEYVMVHPVCLDNLEEADGTPVSWSDSVQLIEELLKPAHRPENLLVFNWRVGDCLLWDNRCVHHALTPTHKHGPEETPMYAALGERRLMTRTSMQPSWVPTLARAPAPAGASDSGSSRL